MLHDGESALVVDPGDAAPVHVALRQNALRLDAILVTHHHGDHTGGIEELRAATGARVYGPALERIPGNPQPVSDGDTVQLLGMQFTVMLVPGHTAGHVAYYAPDVDGAPLLFCGDTLFSGGCGRLFEGTPQDMLGSLSRFAALPPNSRICCTHEYTLSNLKFARTVEPENVQLEAYQRHCESLRAQNLPTLPSSLQTELQINPFLRSHVPSVQAAAQQHSAQLTAQSGVFACLREWKNNYR